MSPAANNTIDRWFDRLDKSMSKWGTSTIVLGVLIAFGWQHGGPWVDAKAESEKAIGTAFKKLVESQEKQEAMLVSVQSSFERVNEQHRQHSEILQEIATVLKGLCDKSKNAPTQPLTSES